METLIEFKFLNSCFSSSNFSIRGNSISVNSTLSPPYDLFKCPTDQIGRFLAVGETLIGEQYWWRLTRGIYIYIYMYIHTYIHTCTFIHIHTHSYTFIHIHTHSYTFIHIHTHSYTFIHIHTHSYTFIHIYTYTHIQRERERDTHNYIIVYVKRGVGRRFPGMGWLWMVLTQELRRAAGGIRTAPVAASMSHVRGYIITSATCVSETHTPCVF